MSERWSAIDAAQRRQVPRVPFCVAGQEVGSVARSHLEPLQETAGTRLRIDKTGVHLDAPRSGRDAVLAALNAGLRERGLLRAWRDEAFALFSADGGEVLAHFERAAARFWGTLTLGAHANGYVAGPQGRPTHLWIATRASTKATDPGLRDNLVGGGVPLGQTPFETLVREGWEEAGLHPSEMHEARRGRVIRIDRDAPEGRMVEHVHAFDIHLPAQRTPRNQDGEVAQLQCLDIESVIELAASEHMTVDAALVTLDFLLRWQLLPAPELERLERRTAGLWVGPA